MLAGDTAVPDELCSDDLIYTHSKADYDDKRSYLHAYSCPAAPLFRSPLTGRKCHSSGPQSKSDRYTGDYGNNGL